MAVPVPVEVVAGLVVVVSPQPMDDSNAEPKIIAQINLLIESPVFDVAQGKHPFSPDEESGR